MLAGLPTQRDNNNSQLRHNQNIVFVADRKVRARASSRLLDGFEHDAFNRV